MDGSVEDAERQPSVGLDVENRRLREANPQTSELIDRESELQKARSDAAEMTERVQANEQGLIEHAGAVEEAEQRAVNAEERTRELERRLSELQAELTEARLESGERSSQRRHEFQEVEGQLAEATMEVRRLEQQVADLQRSCAAEKEAVLQQSELSRYRALEEERHKWEERELLQLEVIFFRASISLISSFLRTSELSSWPILSRNCSSTAASCAAMVVSAVGRPVALVARSSSSTPARSSHKRRREPSWLCGGLGSGVWRSLE